MFSVFEYYYSSVKMFKMSKEKLYNGRVLFLHCNKNVYCFFSWEGYLGA